MKKRYIFLTIGIIFLITLTLLVGTRKRRSSPTQKPPISFPGVELKTPSSPTLPTPTAPLSERTYQVIISESELNTYLTVGLINPTQAADNPITRAKIILYEGKGFLEAYWQKGQTLTAEIHVTTGGKNLIIKNLNVTGAGLLKSVFEKVAYDFLNGVVNKFISESGNLEKIEVKPGQLILYYRLG